MKHDRSLLLKEQRQRQHKQIVCPSLTSNLSCPPPSPKTSANVFDAVYARNKQDWFNQHPVFFRSRPIVPAPAVVEATVAEWA